MKLLNTIAYYIKHNHQPFFKASHRHHKNNETSQVSHKHQGNKLSNQSSIPKSQIQMLMDSKNTQNLPKTHHEFNIIQADKTIPASQSPQSASNQSSNHQGFTKKNTNDSSNNNKITQLLRHTELPMELFNIHEQYCKQFTHNNYEHLIAKLGFSFHHQATTLRILDAKMKRAPESKKEKDSRGKVENSPYVFFTKEQLIRHASWKLIIQQMINKLKEAQDISSFNQYLPVFLHIQKDFNFIPAEIYQQVLVNNATAHFSSLTAPQITNLARLLKYKSRVKQVLQDYQTKQQSIKIHQFIQRVISEIIKHPHKYSKEDFMNVFIIINRRKGRLYMSQELLNISEQTILKYVSELSFENIFTFMKVYASLCSSPNRNLLETLKIRLQSKCQFQTNIYSLLMVLHNNIRQKKLVLKNITAKGVTQSFIHIQAELLTDKIAKIISNHLSKFKPTLIIEFLDSCFHNQIKDSSILCAISAELQKIGKQLRLEVIGKALFKLSLLGMNSSELPNDVFRQYVKIYHQQMASLHQDSDFTVPSEANQPVQNVNFRQIYLQQCLIMVLWVLSRQVQWIQLSKSKQLQSIFPHKLESMDPLAIELAQQINHRLEKQSQLRIQWQFIPNAFPQGRFSQFYLYDWSKNEVELVMWEEARQSGKFIANYNFETNKYLTERWSSPKSTYKLEDYIHFCQEFQSKGNGHCCFFSEGIELSNEFIEKRSQAIKKYKKNIGTSPFTDGQQSQTQQLLESI